MLRRIWTGLLALCLAAALLTTPQVARAAAGGDTPLGDYREAPYREVVTMVDRYGVEFLEIPWEQVFNPELLDRTVVVNGREWQDLVLVMRMDDVTGTANEPRYYVYDLLEDRRFGGRDFHEIMAAGWVQELPPAERRAVEDEAYDYVVRSRLGLEVMSMRNYPFVERFVSINGRPWQETPWRDQILAEVNQMEPTVLLRSNPTVWSIFMDPASNGHGAETYLALRQPVNEGEGQTEAVDAVTDPSVAPVTESQQAPGAATESTPVTPAPEPTLTTPVTEPKTTVVNTTDQVVLSLGHPEVARYRNGQVEIVTMDAPIQSLDGVTMISLRGVLDVFGAQVSYWEQTVLITEGPVSIMLHDGSASAWVNGEVVPLPRPVETVSGRLLVPLRAVAETLGYQVLWDPVTSSVTVQK